MPDPYPPGTPDALVKAIEAALAPYDEVLTPEARIRWRLEMVDALSTHPHGARLLRELSPAPVVEQSGSNEPEAQASDKAAGGSKEGA